jgi:hypothetical protein
VVAFEILVGVAILVIGIVAVVDIAKRPSEAFQRAGQNRTMWLLLVILLTVFCGIIGVVVSIFYLVNIRPKVAAVMGGGEASGTPLPPPPPV